MNVPVITAHRERQRQAENDRAFSTAVEVFAKSVSDAGTVEKAGMMGTSLSPSSSWGSMSNAGPGAAQQTSLIARATQNLAKGFNKSPEQVEQALTEQGLAWAPAFGPGRPLDPYAGYRVGARTQNYPVGSNVQITPRSNRVSFETIKSIYSVYDVAQICVKHLINDVRSLDYAWQPIPGIKTDVSEDIEKAIQFFNAPDKRQPFRLWLAEFLQDVLRYDAGALYIRRSEDGTPIALEIVDGTTIIPLVDYFGRRPEDEDGSEEAAGVFQSEVVPAFVQVINGLPWDWLTSDDLIYLPWNPLPDSQYGMSALESILISANTDLRFQYWFLSVFTEGTIPAGFAEAPPDQSDPAQLQQWQEAWDAIMEGDAAKKSQIRWVPSGTKFTEAKPGANEFHEEFPLYLMRRCTAAYGVTPADLGYTENTNKSSGDTQIDVQFRVGTAPLLRYIEDIINLFVAEHLHLKCQLHFDDGQETEDRVASAQAAAIDIDHGVISVEERRTELGYAIDRSRPVGRYINNPRSGPIPLIALESMSGKINEETYGPADEQELVSTPFVSAPGPVPPQGSPEQKAASDSTAQNARDLIAATTGKKPSVPEVAPEATKATDWQSVFALLDEMEATKATAGITSATGIQGVDLAGKVTSLVPGDVEDDEDDEDDEAEKQQHIALSMRRWRDNSRKRLKKGQAPKRFTDPDLPQSVLDDVWKHLEGANTREEIDKAFDPPKAQAAARAAFHHNADRIVSHYAPQIAKALGDVFTPAYLDAAVRAAYAKDGRATKAGPGADALSRALTGLYGDSFLQGTHDAAHAAGSTVAASLAGVSENAPSAYWDAWTPGYGEAAAKAADGGMRTMLDEAGIRIKGMTNETTDRIGNTIGEGLSRGDSIEATGKAVRDVVANPGRAEMIANTEYARATTAASMQTYTEAGIEKKEWMAEDDACEECQENADAGVIAIDDEFPNGDVPVHPNCRCAIAPVGEATTEPEAGEVEPEPLEPAPEEALAPEAEAIADIPTDASDINSSDDAIAFIRDATGDSELPVEFGDKLTNSANAKVKPGSQAEIYKEQALEIMRGMARGIGDATDVLGREVTHIDGVYGTGYHGAGPLIKLPGRAMMATRKDSSGVYLLINDKRSFADLAEHASGFTAKASRDAYGCTLHEMGHVVTFNSGTAGELLDRVGKQGILGELRPSGPLMKWISEYGTQDAHEAWAESFATLMRPGAMDEQIGALLTAEQRAKLEAAGLSSAPNDSVLKAALEQLRENWNKLVPNVSIPKRG